MIFVDANVFMRFFVVPGTDQDRVMAAQAAALFERVRAAQVTIIVSEAVVAEVAFILTARARYARPRTDAVGLLKSVLRLDGCRLPAKPICLHALDLWAANSRLSFPDALGAAYSERAGYQLATFDERLKRAPGVTVYAFPAVPSPTHDDLTSS
jgi:predicted nucleic acid-binding protein